MKLKTIFLIFATIYIFPLTPLSASTEENTHSDFKWVGLITKILEEKQTTLKKDQVTLSDLIDIALTRNPSLREGWSTTKSAYYTYKQNQGLYFPNIDITSSANKTHNSLSYENDQLSYASSTNYKTFVPQATASYLIWDFGVRDATVEEAYQSMLSQEHSYKWMIQGILKTVITNYYEYLNAIATLEAYQADLEDSKKSLQSAEERSKAGVATIADVLQAKSNYAKQQMQVVTQTGNLKSSLGNLSISVGLPANSQLTIAPANQEIQTAKVMNQLDQLITLATKTRADILSEEAKVSMKESQVKKNKGDLFPSINSSFTINKTYYDHSSTNGVDWTGTIQMSFPLFKGGSIYNQYKASKQSLLVERYNLKDQLQTVGYDVLNDYYTLDSAKKNLSYSKEYLESSQENYNVALANYNAGTGNILDLLTAQSSLAEAREARVEAVTTWYTSIVNLAYSIGLLWIPDADGRIDTMMSQLN